MLLQSWRIQEAYSLWLGERLAWHRQHGWLAWGNDGGRSDPAGARYAASEHGQ